MIVHCYIYAIYVLLYQSDHNICFMYVLRCNTLFCIQDIDFFNFSLFNLYFTGVDENKFS